MASAWASNCSAGVRVFFQHRWMQIPGSSTTASFPSHLLTGWPGNSQARICLFCFRILVFQKSPTIYHSSERLWVYSGWMLFSLPTPLLSPSCSTSHPHGKSRKTRFYLSKPLETPRNCWNRHNNGSNRTIYRIVNTNCSVEWQKIMK